ncbi:metalloregulator ArsR/SmtB family transcription factor [Georgenia sp. TF02-10]|uniref:ArsR/SmtB family transcription factor n=1 Tax=Georgenia sp. TF02-10 TaxID=2917725 RepID=UPI001FA7FC21|nr:metalloregulator ArsR/SmtB family transcription factor [Georgenia sp. TF02-10]UNX55540.1 metalloregulator ArsR/SmtB family transcription factor [Georgenia sp. TF02-10]
MPVAQEELSRTFAALADPTRRQVLERLSRRPATLKELAAPLAMTQQSVSRHLQILEQAGLISRGRQAQWRPCELRGERLQAASEWLDQYRQFWESSFDRLSDHLQDAPPRPHQEEPHA